MNAPEVVRKLLIVERAADDHVHVDGRKLLNLASNNYLGLATDPRVIQAAVDATRVWGVGSGSSPLLSGYSQLHATLADRISAWKTSDLLTADRTELRAATGVSNPNPIRTILFSSGYAANLAALSVLPPAETQIFSDRKNHASLVDGLRMAAEQQRSLTIRHYPHQNFAELRRLLAASDSGRPRWIVTDSIFSMDGTCTRPSDLTELALEFDATLLVDEAHATGVAGPGGAGLFSFAAGALTAAPTAATVPALIVVGTLSKALGSCGGFITGSAAAMDRLVQAARTLIYSTSLPIPAVAAATTALEIAASDPGRRRRLAEHVRTLHEQLRGQGWRTSGDPEAPLLAVIAGTARQAEVLADALLEKGIWAPAIRPPTVKPLECRVRLSPTATMSEDSIAQVVSAFAGLPAAWRSAKS